MLSLGSEMQKYRKRTYSSEKRVPICMFSMCLEWPEIR
jgi:hypothetical protein